MKNLLSSIAIAAILTVSGTSIVAAQDHDDHRKYHDRRGHDDHEWNDHENEAYKIWVRENHRKYREFNELKESERQSYWNWRHRHSDAILKIEIH